MSIKTLAEQVRDGNAPAQLRHFVTTYALASRRDNKKDG
jgi:hypothetical protein